ncbi:hypothetical protein [Methylotuvimicrobium sp. KM1]
MTTVATKPCLRRRVRIPNRLACVELAYWAHVRRKFFDRYQAD